MLRLGLLPIAALGLQAPGASADPAVQFLEETPLEFVLGDGKVSPPTATVSVVVSDSSPGTEVTLEVVPGDAEGVSVEPVSTKGTRFEFQVEVRPAAGVFDGQLVATTSEGALARRPLKIKARAAADIPLPSSVTLYGRARSPLWPRIDVFDSEDPAFGARKQGVVGAVSSESGDLATVVITGDELTVSGVADAGTYKGKVDLSESDGDEFDVTLYVRDFFLWPLIMLSVGIWIATRMGIFRDLGAPGRRLRIRVRQLGDDAEKARAVMEDRLDPADRHVGLPRVAQRERGGRPLLFDNEEAAALVAWQTALDQADRDDWKRSGDRFKELLELLEQYEQMLSTIFTCWQFRAELIDRGQELEIQDEVSSSAALIEMGRLTTPSVIEKRVELAQASEDATQLSSALEILADLTLAAAHAESAAKAKLIGRAKKFLEMRPRDVVKQKDEALAQVSDPSKPQQSGAKQAVASLQDRLRLLAPSLEAPTGQWTLQTYLAPIDAVESYREASYPLYDVVESGVHYVVAAKDPASASVVARAGLRTSTGDEPAGGVVVLSSRALDDPRLSVIATVAGTSPPVVRPDAPGVTTTADLLQEYQRSQRFYSWGAAVLTVLSGMATLYLAEPAFGSMADYVEVFVWGTAVGKGADIAANVLALR